MNQTSAIRTAVKEIFPFGVMFNNKLKRGRRLKFVTMRQRMTEKTTKATIALIKMRLGALRLRFLSVSLIQPQFQGTKNHFYHAIEVIYPETNAPEQLALM